MRCVHGDAEEEASYRAALGERRADLLLTDPPYCLLTRRRKGGDPRDPKHRKIERGPLRRFESVKDYRHFTARWLPKAISHLKPSAPLVLWTNFLGKAPLLEVASGQGYAHLAGELSWAKRTREGGAEQLFRVFEVALVLFREPPPRRSVGDLPTVWSVLGGYDDDGEAETWGNHPNHKPFSVLEPLVRTYSRPGDWILDPFAGSGSIPAAALRLERHAAAIEREAEWAERVTRRVREQTPS